MPTLDLSGLGVISGPWSKFVPGISVEPPRLINVRSVTSPFHPHDRRTFDRRGCFSRLVMLRHESV